MFSKMCVTFLAVLFLALCVSAQQSPPVSTPLPPTTAPKEEPDIELNTVLMESTFMIQGQSARGPILGTVFIVARPLSNLAPTRGMPVLVTAAHVLEEMQGDTAVLNLRRRVDDKTNSWVKVPITLQIRTNGQPNWIRNPHADVAVMYVIIPPDTPITSFTPVTVNMFADDEKLKEYNVNPGDELRCLGYPLGNSSNDAGFPVLRSGRIASYPLYPTENTKTFLLDFRVFKGNSGGPVYFVERMRPNPTSIGSYTNFHFIMGLVSEETLFTEHSGGPYSEEIHQTQLGLATVVHASLIKQTIEMLPALSLAP